MKCYYIFTARRSPSFRPICRCFRRATRRFRHARCALFEFRSTAAAVAFYKTHDLILPGVAAFLPFLAVIFSAPEPPLMISSCRSSPPPASHIMLICHFPYAATPADATCALLSFCPPCRHPFFMLLSRPRLSMPTTIFQVLLYIYYFCSEPPRRLLAALAPPRQQRFRAFYAASEPSALFRAAERRPRCALRRHDAAAAPCRPKRDVPRAACALPPPPRLPARRCFRDLPDISFC